MYGVFWLLLVGLSIVATVNSVDTYSRKDFPPRFAFGAATSAYQVEGAADEDGRTPSIMDTFIPPGSKNGDVAAGEYYHYKEDVKLMVETGLDAYRFSISWPRLIPNGRGPVNPKGLQYYNNLINELVRHGIEPHVTLFHYDLPLPLEDEYGGWLSRKIIKDFTAFADVCFREFGDRVRFWNTFNEPNIHVLVSYDAGLLPPYRCSSPFGFNCTKGNSTSEPYLAAHNMLLSHASVASLYRKKYKGKQFGSVGISIYASGARPLTNSTEDAIATRRFLDFFQGIIADPVIFGDYPEIVKKTAGSRLPAFTKKESELVKNSCDFIGIIHYNTFYIKDNKDSLKRDTRDYFLDMAVGINFEEFNISQYEYPVVPSGLQGVLEYFKQVYGNPPIYILENGQRTKRGADLEDTARVEYIQGYLGAVVDAIRNGSNTRGYFVWSLMDLFELIDGYESTFGLYSVDLDDPELKRQAKLSAHWYSYFLHGGTVSPDGIIKLGKEFVSSLSRNHLSQ